MGAREEWNRLRAALQRSAGIAQTMETLGDLVALGNPMLDVDKAVALNREIKDVTMGLVTCWHRCRRLEETPSPNARRIRLLADDTERLINRHATAVEALSALLATTTKELN